MNELAIISKIVVRLPSIQFYILYDSDGSLIIEGLNFDSVQEIYEFYHNTPNFYRWVYSNNINEDTGWNLDRVLRPKMYVKAIKQNLELPNG